jgi:hypothetical protein|tara:strand:+ start:170 stop:472 length:303 start_codon:yes stop_codon:yes gene_type:complete
MIGTALTWEDSDWLWNDNPFTWGEITLAEQVAVSKSSDIKQILNADDQKRFIKLVCKVKGIETYSGQKTINDDIEVTADDINLVVKKVLGIDLMVENINV